MIRNERLLVRALAVAALCALSACTPDSEPNPNPEPNPAPQCSSEQLSCSGECKDPRRDAQNCGACGRACAAGETCEAGTCTPPPTTCTPAQTACSGVCKDLGNDVQNCGICGRACATGETCQAGSCTPPPVTCAPEQTACSNVCKDLQRDVQNCGACGNACATGEVCTTGRCVTSIVCGDGIINGMETCDDGNATAGDGCNASCELESGFVCSAQPSRCVFSEVEPNSTPETANVVGRATWMRGAIDPGTDKDVFRITLPATADLRLDTFDGSGMERCQTIDTKLELLAEDGTVLASDDDSGIDYCSSIQSGTHPGTRSLPAGNYFVRVTSYDEVIPAYVLRLQYQALCGNGQVEGAELCDDGNTQNGDGCSLFCRSEPSSESEPNNSAASANGPFPVPSVMGGAINPGSDTDVFRITVSATADLRLELFDGSGREACKDIDTKLELLASDGTTVLASDDDDGIGFCSLISPAVYSGARRLAPGTYHARVSSYGGVIPNYILFTRYEALCGDHRVTGSEECDGTPGCTATCERTPVCGDGHFDYPEFCDDGNTANGDACNSTCTAAGLQSEVEPNNTRTEANARASDSTPVLISGNKRLAAAFPSRDDVDVYRMQVSAPTLVRLETFHGGLNQCESGLSSELGLLDSAGVTLASDTQGGMGQCSALAMYLQPGTYYVQTRATDFLGPTSYALDAAIQSSTGVEAEPNDTSATASTFNGVDSFVSGNISTATDVDSYRITVPAGGSLRAEILEGDGLNCDSRDLDSHLSLLDATGNVLASNDDAGRGFCSRIDGLGSSSDDLGANNLPAGTYYLVVKRSPAPASGSLSTFGYRLSVTLR